MTEPSTGRRIDQVASARQGDVVTTRSKHSKLHCLKSLNLASEVVTTYCGRRWSWRGRTYLVPLWWDQDDNREKMERDYSISGFRSLSKTVCARCRVRFFKEYPDRAPRIEESGRNR